MTRTTNRRRFRDSLLADRLIRVFAGGGAFLFAATAVSSVIRLMMALFTGEEPGGALGLIALVSAAAAAALGALYLKHVRRSQNTERLSKCVDE